VDYTPATEVQVTDEHFEAARELGREHGHNAATWVEEPVALLKGIEEGDPQVMDALPQPLSGEWAGEFGLDDMLRDLDLPAYTDDTCVAYEDLILAYEEAFHLAYVATLESVVSEH
jgi:hypothetical protein